MVEWDGFNFKTNKFLNGLWGRNFGGDLGGRFWSVFGVAAEWCVGRENDMNHFLVWELIGIVEIFMERSVVELGGAESV